MQFNPSKAEIKNIPDDTIVSFVEMSSVSNKGFIRNTVDKALGDLRKGSYTYFANGDITLAKITPCMENGKCAIASGLSSGIGMGSSEFHVIRCGESMLNSFVFGYLNRESIRKSAAARMTGASGHRRVPIEFYKELQIPKKSLTEQKKICKIVDEYNRQIEELSAKLTDIQTRKQLILNKYL